MSKPTTASKTITAAPAAALVPQTITLTLTDDRKVICYTQDYISDTDADDLGIAHVEIGTDPRTV